MVNGVLRNEKVVMIITTMQEAFSAIIPFFLLSSFLTLLYVAMQYFHLEILGLDAESIGSLMKDFNAFSSLIATMAIAYFFSLRFKISPIVAAILSVAVFITVLHIESPDRSVELPYGFTPAALFMPVLSAFLLKLFYPIFSLRISIRDGHYHIYRLFNYIFVFLAAYLTAVLAYIAVDTVLDDLIVKLDGISADLPGILRLALRDFFVQLFWFFGIHGAHVVNGLAGKEILTEPMLPHLTYGEFHRLFVSIGGAGVGLGLLVALLLHARKGSVWLLTRLSAPFVPFNINTLLIYGIVVLNRLFLVPFLFLPLFNLLTAYVVLQLVPIRFTEYTVIWTTPVFVDSYLKGGGTLLPMLLQGTLLIFDIAVYSHYVRRYVAIHSLESKKVLLEKNLDLSTEIQSREHLRSYKAHHEILEADSRLEKLLRTLEEENLSLYYQPKIDLKAERCGAFEALLRYEKDGRMRGPDFLETLEQAGLAPVIDRWVARQAKNDLQRWRSEGFHPEISVNLHPDTVRSRQELLEIVRILQGERITFEIIERSFLHRSDADDNLALLREHGFRIAIDDFGTGYSSLETITRYRIDELKLDKSLIDIIDTRKGYLVCKHTASLCHELGCLVVAEGVEDREQLERIRTIAVDGVQGYLYAPALPPAEAKGYAENFGRGLPVDRS